MIKSNLANFSTSSLLRATLHLSFLWPSVLLYHTPPPAPPNSPLLPNSKVKSPNADALWYFFRIKPRVGCQQVDRWMPPGIALGNRAVKQGTAWESSSSLMPFLPLSFLTFSTGFPLLSQWPHSKAKIPSASGQVGSTAEALDQQVDN